VDQDKEKQFTDTLIVRSKASDQLNQANRKLADAVREISKRNHHG